MLPADIRDALQLVTEKLDDAAAFVARADGISSMT
jgi:hypothetical protein